MTAETRQSSDRMLSADEGFLTYPIHRVVAVFEDRNAIDAAVEELKQNDFPADEIKALCGIEGEAKMDFTGERHGAWTTFVRAAQHIGPDRTYLERHEKAYARDTASLWSTSPTSGERPWPPRYCTNIHRNKLHISAC